jgi:hypothetical protein
MQQQRSHYLSDIDSTQQAGELGLGRRAIDAVHDLHRQNSTSESVSRHVLIGTTSEEGNTSQRDDVNMQRLVHRACFQR